MCEFNKGFLLCVECNCLWLWVKLVVSFDGCIVMVDGSFKWIIGLVVCEDV